MAPWTLALLSLSMVGVGVVLLSGSWAGMWFGLELNLFGFVPFLAGPQRAPHMESAIVYFLAQEFGSVLLILALAFSFPVTTPLPVPTPLLTLPGLLLKLGGAPFHLWLPAAMSGATWPATFLLSSTQKVGPMVMMVMVVGPSNGGVVCAIGGVGAVVGGVGGSFQTRLRPLLAYSSVAHVSWCLACVPIGVAPTIAYLAFYFPTLAVAFILLANHSSPPPATALSIIAAGGFPPSPVFFGKLLAIWGCWQTFAPAVPLLLGGGVMSFFFYFKLSLKVGFPSSSIKMRTIASCVSPSALGWECSLRSVVLMMRSWLIARSRGTGEVHGGFWCPSCEVRVPFLVASVAETLGCKPKKGLLLTPQPVFYVDLKSTVEHRSVPWAT